MTPNLSFPIFIDSTMLNDFRLCEQKWAWRYLHHLVPASPNVHLNAGGAFAKGLEIARRSFYEQGQSQEDSVAFGLKALLEAYGDAQDESGKKTWEAVSGALIYYCDNHPFASDYLQPFVVDGKATLEFSAAIPLPLNHPQTGEPLLLTGRFDMLARHQHMDAKRAFCVDEKTTGRIDPGWATKWPLRGQFLCYNWLAGEQGYDIAGTIVRGIAIYKNSYTLVEVPIQSQPWKIKEWHDGMLGTVAAMIRVWREVHEAKSRSFVKALNDACTMYNGCSYIRLCDSQKPELWMEPYFERREWNPIHTETTA